MEYLFGWSKALSGDEGVVAAICSKLHPKVAQVINGERSMGGSAVGLCCVQKGYQQTCGSITVCVNGRPFWGDDGKIDAVLQKCIDSYLEQGESFIRNLKGAFAIALFDESNNKILLGIDRIGQKCIYYSETNNGLVFGTRADYVSNHPAVEKVLNPQSLYDYVYFHHCPSPGTIFREINKLEGGEILSFDGDKISVDQYWLPRFDKTEKYDIQEKAKQLKQTFLNSVNAQIDDISETGAFLSGGLDSSSVAGAVATTHEGNTKTFSIGFSEEKYNELGYANIAVEHFGCKQFEYILEPDEAVDSISQIASYYDEPFGNSSALPAYFCATLAKENNVSLLLAGDGGDEIFAGNERYLKQLLFEDYKRVPSVIRGGLNGALTNFPKIFDSNRILTKIKRYVEQAQTPLPDRMQDYNFLHRHLPEEVFSKDFLAQVDINQPLESLRQTFFRPIDADSLDRMLYLDWKITLHDNDLVKVNRMCELAGVDVRYPMLSDEMIDFSIGIPSAVKLNKRQLRWFYKYAMRDFLPEKILNKSKHGFGLPFGVWLDEYARLKELAYDSVTNLKSRGYFSKEFIDHAIDMHRNVHAAYYGELVWILMMLELWMQNNL